MFLFKFHVCTLYLHKDHSNAYLSSYKPYFSLIFFFISLIKKIFFLIKIHEIMVILTTSIILFTGHSISMCFIACALHAHQNIYFKYLPSGRWKVVNIAVGAHCSLQICSDTPASAVIFLKQLP